MRVIIIDPWTRTVDEASIEVTPDSFGVYKDFKRMVFGATPPPWSCIGVVRLGAGQCMAIDDDGMNRPEAHQVYFAIGSRTNHRDIAGRGVIYGVTPDGNYTDCGLPLALARQTVRWLDPREVVREPLRVVPINDLSELGSAWDYLQ